MDNLILKQFEKKDRNFFIFEDVTDILANDLYKFYDNIIKTDNEVETNNEAEIRKIYKDINFNFDNKKYRPEVNIYLNTFGGYCYNGFSICNIIKLLNEHCKVNVIATGCCMSMGIPILLSVPYEQRFCYKYTTFMIHQASGISIGKVKDMEDSVKETKRLNDIMFNIIIENTTITKEELDLNFNKKEDWFLTPEEGLKYKIISKII